MTNPPKIKWFSDPDPERPAGYRICWRCKKNPCDPRYRFCNACIKASANVRYKVAKRILANYNIRTKGVY
jgi:hypothetical protein